MKTKILLFFCIVCVPFSLSAQLFVGDDNFGNDFLSAFEAAKLDESGTILVKGNVTTDDLEGAIDIDVDSMVIKGYQDASIHFKNDGSLKIRIQTDKVLVIDNLRVTSDASAGGQGGLLNSGNDSRTYLLNSHFREISAVTHGGLISMNGFLYVNNCVFEACTSERIGGVIFDRANGVSDIRIYNSRFIRNTASTGADFEKGGAIALLHPETTVYIENCLFEENSCLFIDADEQAHGFGGAIYSQATSFTAVNCTFFRNSSGSAGGAIHIRESTPREISLINCTMSENFTYGTPDLGGGIHSDATGTNLKIYNSIIQGNYSKIESDGSSASNVAGSNESSLQAENSFIPAIIKDGSFTVTGNYSPEAATLVSPELSDDGVLILVGASTAKKYGDPDFLSPFTNTDQRGWIRLMSEPIDAGAYDSDAYAPDSILILRWIPDSTIVTGINQGVEHIISLEGVFGVLDPEPANPLTYSAESADEEVVTVDVSENNLILNTLPEVEGSAEIIVTAIYEGYDETVTKQISFAVNVVIDETVTVRDIGISQVRLYPNPAQSKLTLESDFDIDNAFIVILNLSGQKLSAPVVSSSPHGAIIDVSHLDAGIYILNIRTLNNNVLKKFIKM